MSTENTIQPAMPDSRTDKGVGCGELVRRLRDDADWWDKWGKGAINKRAIAEVKPDLLRAAANEIERLRTALAAALPVLEEHADEERVFWGDDKHGLAREAEEIHQQAKAALSPNMEMRDAPGAPVQRHSEHENTK